MFPYIPVKRFSGVPSLNKFGSDLWRNNLLVCSGLIGLSRVKLFRDRFVAFGKLLTTLCCEMFWPYVSERM